MQKGITLVQLAETLRQIEANETNYPLRNTLIYKAVYEASVLGLPAGVRLDTQQLNWPVAYISLPRDANRTPKPDVSRKINGRVIIVSGDDEDLLGAARVDADGEAYVEFGSREMPLWVAVTNRTPYDKDHILASTVEYLDGNRCNHSRWNLRMVRTHPNKIYPLKSRWVRFVQRITKSVTADQKLLLEKQVSDTAELEATRNDLIDYWCPQVSWHLPQYNRAWDGHTTEEKYETIRSFVNSVLGEEEPLEKTF